MVSFLPPTLTNVSCTSVPFNFWALALAFMMKHRDTPLSHITFNQMCLDCICCTCRRMSRIRFGQYRCLLCHERKSYLFCGIHFLLLGSFHHCEQMDDAFPCNNLSHNFLCVGNPSCDGQISDTTNAPFYLSVIVCILLLILTNIICSRWSIVLIYHEMCIW